MRILLFPLIIFTGVSVMSAEPVIKLHIERGTNPWSGMTSTHQEESASRYVKAHSLADSDFSFFAHLDSYKIKKKSMIGKSKTGKFIAVEKLFFSDLNRADATRIQENAVQKIGIFNAAALKEIAPTRLASFLIESQIIITYWHIGSTLERVKEETSGAIYSARFKGEHVYFTNSKEIVPLDFNIIINIKTGEMSINGN